MTLVKLNGRPVAKYDSLFDDFFGFPRSRGGNYTGTPAANITETPASYLIDLLAPGRNKEEFKVNIEKNLLTVAFESKTEQPAEGTRNIRKEFNIDSFKRSFTLDETIDATGIQARYDNGVLRIELPKKEEVKREPKQITIE